MNITKGKWYLQKYTDAYTNIVRCDNGKGFETLFIAATPQGGANARDNALLMSKSPRMAEALKWFVNAMSDGSLIVFTDDVNHKAVRDDNQDHINEIEALVKELE